MSMPRYHVTSDQRDSVLHDTFLQMAHLFMEARTGLSLDSREARARIEAFYPRMHWLALDGDVGRINGRPDVWRPTYYGLPADEPFVPATHKDQK